MAIQNRNPHPSGNRRKRIFGAVENPPRAKSRFVRPDQSPKHPHVLAPWISVPIPVNPCRKQQFSPLYCSIHAHSQPINSKNSRKTPPYTRAIARKSRKTNPIKPNPNISERSADPLGEALSIEYLTHSTTTSLSSCLRGNKPIMQNKPNLRKRQILTTPCSKQTCNQYNPNQHEKNKPNSKPICPGQAHHEPEPPTTISCPSCQSSAISEPSCHSGNESIMQNKPNSKTPTNTPTSFPKRTYARIRPKPQEKNKPNSNPIRANRNDIRHPASGIRKTNPIPSGQAASPQYAI